MFLLKKVAITVSTATFAFLVGCSGANSNVTAESSGEQIFVTSCAGCHSGGFKGWMTGAPAIGDKDAWKPLAEKGVEAMTMFSIKGVNKMPARGGCQQCTDEQIRNTVQYMLEQSQ